MKKILLLIIVLSFIILLPSLAYAREYEDCIGDAYSNDFICEDEEIVPFCASLISSLFGIYGPAYCDGIKNTDDEIYEIVARQFDIEDEDLIKTILAGGKIDPDDMPDSLKEYYNFGEQIETLSLTPLYLDVLAAYEKEKVIYQMQQAFKREFESSEEWYNATLLDSSMDLVVDLNLIDVMLFGSQAQWNNDVYRFPQEEDEGTDEEAPLEEPGGGRGEERTESSEPQAGAGQEDEGETAPDCVPEDSQEALPPSPTEIPQNCGNNILNPREQCDDGNNNSGDGCSNVCSLEDIGSILCRDTEAVTFRNYQPGNNSAGSTIGPSVEQPSNEPQCPQGSRPRRDRQQQETDQLGSFPQTPHYPEPLPGVLKAFPPSAEPACPPGYSELNVDFVDVSEWPPRTGTASPSDISYLGIPRCIPTEWCASPDIVRDFLFTPFGGWRNNHNPFIPNLIGMSPTVKQVAESIESIFCVNVSTANRPETPYALNEGCIDCHIRAMVRELDKLLEYQIAPMENPRNSFGISNRWGPSISSDLNTAIRANPKTSKLKTALEEIKKDSEAEKERQQDRAHQIDPAKGIKQPDIAKYEEIETLLKEFNTFNSKQDEQYFESLKNYRLNSSSAKQSEFSLRIIPLLNQWKASFANIQNVYVEILQADKFAEKQKCR